MYDMPHFIPITALMLYITGGAGTFTGIAFLAFNINAGTGAGLTLLICGVLLSMTGVVLMRIARNRTEQRIRNLAKVA